MKTKDQILKEVASDVAKAICTDRVLSYEDLARRANLSRTLAVLVAKRLAEYRILSVHRVGRKAALVASGNFMNMPWDAQEVWIKGAIEDNL